MHLQVGSHDQCNFQICYNLNVHVKCHRLFGMKWIDWSGCCLEHYQIACLEQNTQVICLHVVWKGIVAHCSGCLELDFTFRHSIYILSLRNMKGTDDSTSARWCHGDHSIYILSSEDQFIVSLSRVMGGVMVIMTQLDVILLLCCQAYGTCMFFFIFFAYVTCMFFRHSQTR